MLLRRCGIKQKGRGYFTLESKAIWLVAQGGNINVNGQPTNDHPRVIIRHFYQKEYELKHHAVGTCKYGSMGIWILVKNENE